MKPKYYYDTCSLYVSYTDAEGVMHTEVARKIFKKDLSLYATNMWQVESEIDNINNVTIYFNNYDDISDPNVKGFIFQVGGYSNRRGLFCDMYNIPERT